MGRKISTDRTDRILRAVGENDGKLSATGVAKLLGLYPQAVIRALTALEVRPKKYLYEDDNGFLSIFKK